MAKIIPANKARQGRRGVHLLIILIAGLLLALAVWGGVEFYGEMIQTPATHQTSNG